MEGDTLDIIHILPPLDFNPLPPHGGRQRKSQHPATMTHFNPLPPHGGRQLLAHSYILRLQRFQSTPSAWRETPFLCLFVRSRKVISIHSLRMEGDSSSTSPCLGRWVFQSTPSAWRETPVGIPEKQKCNISIHSLRMEGDESQVS